MIELSRVSYELPGRTLFDQLSLRLNDHDHVALVGPNGSGKTTLLRMLTGQIEPDSGQVSRTRRSTVGYLPQEGITHQGRSILAEARSVFDELLSLKQEIAELEGRLEAGHADEAALQRYSEALEEFRHRGGYDIDARVARVLDGLGFERSDWDKDASVLSGGWQMRLALAKLLIQQPDTLLLDEPTNHLDLLANNWLEDYLQQYEGAFILVSHDRHFLDNVVSHVCDLRYGGIRVFTGNYTRYLEESEKEIEILEERKRRQDEQIEKMERFINKFRYQATKARQVQSRIKELDKVERIELPRPQAQVAFRFPEPPRSGRRVIELTGVGKAYGDNVVFRGLDFVVERGDRLALVGPNGAGKSTLMRILAGRESHQGERKLGHNVDFAYFAQDEGANLDPTATVLEEVTKVAPSAVVPSLRSLLGAFLFRGDDVFKPISVLSGGEKTRVALCRMLLEPHNLLLLDEPTNHLDLASKEVLLQSLCGFTGTVVLVSHDRYFLDRLATRIADVGHGQVLVYPGGYEEYLTRPGASGVGAGSAGTPAKPAGTAVKPVAPASRQQGAAASRPQSAPASRPRGEPTSRPQGTPAEPAGNPAEAKRPEAKRPEAKRNTWQEKEHEKKRVALEKRIEEMEGEVKRLEEQMSSPGFFASPASRAEVERHQRLVGEVKELTRQWEQMSS